LRTASELTKLINCVIKFRNHERYRQTDRQTSYDGMTAPLLWSWSGKNKRNISSKT